jgi:hypothetical protein
MESCLSVEGSSPRWIMSIVMGVHTCLRRLTYCHGDHGDYVWSGGIAPMQGIDGLETNAKELFCQACMRGCGYVLSCQALNIAASRETGGHGACLILKSPRS